MSDREYWRDGFPTQYSSTPSLQLIRGEFRLWKQ
jgi:hypothetical protein